MRGNDYTVREGDAGPYQPWVMLGLDNVPVYSLSVQTTGEQDAASLTVTSGGGLVSTRIVIPAEAIGSVIKELITAQNHMDYAKHAQNDDIQGQVAAIDAALAGTDVQDAKEGVA